MLSWIKEKCFVNLEQESQKNNLLLLVIFITYSLGEINVLQNHSIHSPQHIIFLSISLFIFLSGLVLVRIDSLTRPFKYIMMTLLMIHTMVQICIFNNLPEVYQVVYFNLALTLIYLNGYLTLFVGAISLAFTLVARVFFHEYFYLFSNLETINVPFGILLETTVVMWAVTKIGGSFSIILETKNKIAKLLQKNETQLKILQNQNNILEEYATQVETLVQKEERSRIARELQQNLGELLTSVIIEIETVKGLLDDKLAAENKINKVKQNITNAIEIYREALDQLFISVYTQNITDEIRRLAGKFAESTGINVNLNVRNKDDKIFQPYVYIILRAIQESLIQAKYAMASEIQLIVDFGDENIVIKITDNGTGSKENPENKSNFDRLKERIDILNGNLEVVNFKGTGSMVTITLPQKKVYKKNINVLIVDSEPFFRQSLELILSNEEDVTVVNLLENEKQALSFCKEQLPDVILMDLESSEMDGIHTIRFIKENWPQVKVIILTNQHSIGLVVEAIHAGADAYLLKTTSPMNLAMTIRFLMNGGILFSKETTTLLASQLLNCEKIESLEKRIVYHEVIKEYGLKERDIQILQMLSDGLKYREIANNLFLTQGTVRNNISNIYSKLHVKDKQQAIEKAVKLGLIKL